MLPKLRIITPCPQSWETMVGNESSRYCERCNLQVHNFETLSAAETEQLLRKRDGRVCGRGFQDRNGNLTIGVRPRVTSRILTAALSVAISMGAATAQNVCHRHVSEAQPNADASVTIRVTDATGAVVPNARVTLQSLKGEIEIMVGGITDQNGAWRAGSLALGTYKLHVNADGFSGNESKLTVSSTTAIVKMVPLEATMLMGVVVEQASVPVPGTNMPLVQIPPVPLVHKNGKME